MLRWIIIQNRQGKSRLSKFWAPYDDDEKVRIRGEVHRLIAPRDQKYQSNFVEYRNHKIVYRRYAGLFFCVCVDANDNELAYLEAIHLFVEILDTFFGNVCELDLVFNFYKVYSILDEVFLAGEIEETSKTVVLSRLDQRMLNALSSLLEHSDKRAGGHFAELVHAQVHIEPSRR
ncbi:AP-2 complex subunit sigma [Tilletia horrida]|nr:AP-2 complex subunit sigma [Tilletia horrida]